MKSEQQIREYMKRHDPDDTSDWDQAMCREHAIEFAKWILDEGEEGDERA